MSEQHVKMVILSTDDLDASIKFYSETLGMGLKFRDGAHYAALDGGSVTLALATAVDHPIPGQVVVGIKTDDVDARGQGCRGQRRRHREGPVRRRPRAPRGGLRQQGQRHRLLQAAGPLVGQMGAAVI